MTERLSVPNYDKKSWTVMVPISFLTSRLMTPAEKTLYLLLCSYVRDKENCWPGQARLARELGVAAKTLRVWFKDLYNKGIIGWTKEKTSEDSTTTANHYFFPCMRSPTDIFDPALRTIPTNKKMVRRDEKKAEAAKARWAAARSKLKVI
jgi:hypothetical protein